MVRMTLARQHDLLDDAVIGYPTLDTSGFRELG